MSLHQYEIDFSPLSLDEKTALIDRIKNNAFTCPDFKQGFQSATFCIEESNIKLLNVPADCPIVLLQ